MLRLFVSRVIAYNRHPNHALLRHSSGNSTTTTADAPLQAVLGQIQHTNRGLIRNRPLPCVRTSTSMYSRAIPTRSTLCGI